MDMLATGVDLKADVDLQMVFFPHLLSLQDGFSSVEKELHRLNAKGWFNFSSWMPFVPGRYQPSGAVARKLERRFRRVWEAGAPRKPLFDGMVMVVSLNVASSNSTLPGATLKWPKEIKNLPDDAIHDSSILRTAADPLGAPIMDGADDVSDFFNNLFMRTSELWKLCTLWLPLETPTFRADDSTMDASHPVVPGFPQATYVSERVLGFGVVPASNVAQRFANFLVFQALRLFDEIDEPFRQQECADSPFLRAWVARRLLLGPTQARLIALQMYTDDPRFSVVGNSRMVRWLRFWDAFTTSLGLLMAIPAKRQLGSSVLWLGLIQHSMLGITVVPETKALRAAYELHAARAGDLTFQSYRSTLGFLEHLLRTLMTQVLVKIIITSEVLL